MPRDARAAASPQSVTRVIRILEALCASSAPMSLADLARALDAPKSSLAALLRGLAEEDLVLVSDGVWRLGPGAFGLGSALLEGRRRLQTSDLVRDGMRRLAERSGETVLFAVPDEGGSMMTYVDVIESRNAVRFAVSIGDRRPLYCAASGKAVLAYFPPEAQRAYLRRTRFTSFTPQTSGRDAMPELLREIARAAVAFDNGGKVTGASGIASPIFDERGEAIASISVAGPSERILANRARLEAMTRDAGEQVSRLIGYDGSYPPHR